MVSPSVSVRACPALPSIPMPKGMGITPHAIKRYSMIPNKGFDIMTPLFFTEGLKTYLHLNESYGLVHRITKPLFPMPIQN